MLRARVRLGLVAAGVGAMRPGGEQVFEALMDEKYSSAAAVATRRLRISGSLSVASASEPLFDAVEAKLRATRAVAVGGAEAAAAGLRVTLVPPFGQLRAHGPVALNGRLRRRTLLFIRVAAVALEKRLLKAGEPLLHIH